MNWPLIISLISLGISLAGLIFVIIATLIDWRSWEQNITKSQIYTVGLIDGYRITCNTSQKPDDENDDNTGQEQAD